MFSWEIGTPYLLEMLNKVYPTFKAYQLGQYKTAALAAGEDQFTSNYLVIAGTDKEVPTFAVYSVVPQGTRLNLIPMALNHEFDRALVISRYTETIIALQNADQMRFWELTAPYSVPGSLGKGTIGEEYLKGMQTKQQMRNKVYRNPSQGRCPWELPPHSLRLSPKASATQRRAKKVYVQLNDKCDRYTVTQGHQRVQRARQRGDPTITVWVSEQDTDRSIDRACDIYAKIGFVLI